jgi:hypothetical protein
MAMGGRMGSKEMMKSMKKDDKMLQNGGKVTGPKKKISEMSDKELSDMLKRQMNSEINAVTIDSLQRGQEELIKRLSNKKMMYGGSMKKAMYGAKMKKKAMYGAKMKK